MPTENTRTELWEIADAMLNYAKEKGSTGAFSVAALRVIAAIAASMPHEDGSEPFNAENRHMAVEVPWWVIHTIGHAYHRLESHSHPKPTFGKVLGLETSNRGSRPATSDAADLDREINFALAVARELGGDLERPPLGKITKVVQDMAAKHGVSQSWAQKAWAKHSRRIRERAKNSKLPD